MKTIKSLKDITTLEVGDEVVFGDLKYVVTQHPCCKMYYLRARANYNDKIFKVLNINKRDFIEKLGIDANCNGDFPEVKSLEALTAIVSALFKEYEKQNELPKTWEEFCKNTPIQKGECLLNAYSKILETTSTGDNRDADYDKNYYSSKQEAEAHLALMQLRQLRKAYVGSWEPDWSCSLSKFCIIVDVNKIKVGNYCFVRKSLSFPTYNLAEQFLTNFKDLLEIAKPLL